MAKILDLPVITSLPIAPEKVLNAAIENNLQSVIVFGEMEDGELYVSLSDPNLPKALWLMEQIKILMLTGEYSEY